MPFSPPQRIEVPSDRAFGLVMAAFAGLASLIPLWGGKPPFLAGFAVAAAFLLPALCFPAALAPLNRAWARFGEVMGRLLGPVALAVLFFGFVTPYGWLMRRLGKSHMPLAADATVTSYWVPRAPPGPDPMSLHRQF